MTTIGERPLLSSLYDRLLVEDDTEESVSGSDFHLAAIIALYQTLLQYARQTGRRWYVTAEVTILTALPDRPAPPWQAMPDVYVVLNTDPVPRRSFDTRKGLPFPHFVCEVASPSTVDRDLELKQRLYADLGVQEYIVFDPTTEYLGTPLRAWHRLPDGEWASWDPDDGGFLVSRTLGLRLRPEGYLLRVYDPEHGLLPILSEVVEQLAQEREQLALDRAREREQHAQEREQLALDRAREREQHAQEREQLALDRARLRALEEEIARLRRQQPPTVEQ